MTVRLRFATAATTAALLALIAIALLPASTAQADTLPFKAWGSGRTAGQVIVALKGGTQVATATVTADGGWDMNIHGGGAANINNGDMISFTVDGKAAKETISWLSGQFVLTPGLVLTLATTAAATPAPVVTPPVAAGTKFAATPIFDATGRSLAVFTGGSVNDLTTAATDARASGVWVQDSTGMFQLFIVGGPSFIGDQFRAKFTAGFSGFTSVLLTR